LVAAGWSVVHVLCYYAFVSRSVVTLTVPRSERRHGVPALIDLARSRIAEESPARAGELSGEDQTFVAEARGTPRLRV
jgi:hypothetical protein